MHPERVTVWCGLLKWKFLAHIFFQDGNGNTVTVNEEHYQGIVTKFYSQLYMILTHSVCGSSRMLPLATLLVRQSCYCAV